MTSIEVKRIRCDILRAQSARAELELKIDERLEDIERIKAHIQLQDVKIAELTQKLEETSQPG